MDLNPPSSNDMVCEYCGKRFKRASSFEVHVCTKKQRALQRNERRVRYGLYAYNRFNKLSAGQHAQVTYEQFCDSQYYNSFVKFGSYISNVSPLYPEKYIDYVVTSGLKIKDWCNDSVYERYVLDLIRREPAEVAIQRSINTMMEWATEQNSQWQHYFDHVSPNRAVWHIRDGKISPWIVLNVTKGKRLLEKLPDDDLNQIYSVIDPEYWMPVFKRNPGDLKLIQILATEYNL